MNLTKRDEGKVFVAPSRRRIVFEHERGGRYLFVYEDDPSEGLALSLDGLKILERPTRDGRSNSTGAR
ncbi:hypothetical protein [Paraburkholderia caribensis]|uniref:hypothetical protein n=1 Tax=Paraburkholderia caribensis TaxID=75105 RepID=UPI0028644058|nr:hypothetical protein [Paraburkholderia caribensis]MDR6381800.1 hypothetical protein [Paraburkholderia caribensis]